MIQFTAGEFNAQSILDQFPGESAEYEMLDKLISSTYIHRYSSLDELMFEIVMRRKIIDASYALYRGRLSFRTFKESFCNEEFWELAPNGGFVLKGDTRASDGINDIFTNTRKYGTECATAIVMLYYKAALDMYEQDLFNMAFPEITLMNWQEMDELINVTTRRRLPDYIPGDCRYFRNPDVNPLTPEWQGENAIDLGKGIYYGHGIGIGDDGMIIEALNQNRIEDAMASAYLMDTATRPDFKGLYQYKANAA